MSEPYYSGSVWNKKSRAKGNTALMIWRNLTNFENVSISEQIDHALRRIYLLRDLGYDPYVMIYNKPDAPQKIKDLQRWCNNKIIFKKIDKFEDYKPTRKERGW